MMKGSIYSLSSHIDEGKCHFYLPSLKIIKRTFYYRGSNRRYFSLIGEGRKTQHHSFPSIVLSITNEGGEDDSWERLKTFQRK